MSDGLLDDHIRVIGSGLRLALTATASRNRSLDARRLLARAALGQPGSGDAGTLEELLAAARAGDRRWLRRIRRSTDSGLLAAVAQTIALQEQLPEDRDDALALYELIRRALGGRALTPANQALHAQLTLAYRGPEAARRLLRDYREIRDPARTGLEIDLLNPFAGDRPAGPWLDAFRRLLPPPVIELSEQRQHEPFDRLTAAPVEKIETPHRVSVVVTAYRPDQGLLTAVSSIRAQSWANVEIVIVDDASGGEYDEVLARAVAMGERIRLVRLPGNSGTYAARNAGLDAAGGEFVAFQDSDDWSHPRRLELQVKPLLADRRLVATTSDGLAVTDQLLLTRPGVRSGRFNPSSLLFRRSVVMNQIGYFDRVRKAADSEYIGRMQATFGPRAVRHLESASPLALIRLSAGSLSRSEIKPHWMHPGRTAYSSAYLRWHQLIGAGAVSPYRPADGGERPFAAPAHLLGSSPADFEFDLVVVADWRFLESAQRTAIDEMRTCAAAGLRVAVLQLESYRAVHLKRIPLAAPVQDMINDGTIAQVAAGDPVRAEVALVRQAAVLQFTDGMRSGITAGRVIVVADRAPARADGTDRRYEPATCSAAARRLFGTDPEWVTQDAGVRARSRTENERDWPTVLIPPGWVEERSGASRGPVLAGVDLCDAANWPSDVAETLAVCRRLPEADIRVRLPDRPRDMLNIALARGWLGYEASDIGARPFLHQLDFYLHFPPPGAAEHYSRPALEAAAMGCVVVTLERFADLYGDAAVYCTPDEVPHLVARYRADPVLFAEQSRRARAVVARAHDPAAVVERIPVTTAAGRPLPMV
ncbi:glycosyltransferase family A protein [Actinoplanes sp. NPDC051411]|uniref:glycosyltransferase family 2 protein n=1 Tax=Actinoplanes sp. NPDC051411 TaxID=3155522 RepID=UPI00343FEB1C